MDGWLRSELRMSERRVRFSALLLALYLIIGTTRWAQAQQPVIYYVYEAVVRLTTVTDPVGGVTAYTYDASNRLTSITDPRGLTFLTNAYDAQGRVCRQTQADGGLWRFYYIAADAATTSAAQQLLTEAAAGGPITQPPCTVLGTAATVLAAVVVDPLGHPTASRFNANG